MYQFRTFLFFAVLCTSLMLCLDSVSSSVADDSSLRTSNNNYANNSLYEDDHEQHRLGGDVEAHHHYTDQWVLHIPGGAHHAERIAEKHGFENTGKIFEDYYHFSHPKIAKRSLDPHSEYHQLLNAEPQVKWHQQQRVKRRVKRDFLNLTPSRPFRDRKRAISRPGQPTFNDPRWAAMWYLNRGPGLDMNVIEAWAEGITGKGIVVTILDDGLEKDHPDIRRNYDPMASFDVNSVDMDPMPTYDLTDSNRHGTRCAGEVAAEANNSLCAVGVAFEASVGGVRMLDGDVTDAVEARSLSHNPQHIDIYSASWGPDDDGKTVDGPGELATRAFMEGVSKGRSGKGSIFVWASGNGGRDHDNCNCDGYTNSIWTLSISSATENGLVPWYSEACSSTLATTYSSGGTGEKQIVTIDLHHSCTSSHTGTSASAPLAAGICALALQANTNLTWRDMQHIVVRTARPQNLIASDWATNGVGRNVSHSFGYGLMDAGAMVKLARVWKTVPEQNKCEIRAPQTDKNIPAKSKVTLDLKVSNCPGVNFLEHVQAKVTLTSQRRGDLQIYLVSPSGTRSTLLAHRRHDLNRAGFTDWPFMSVHSWGESPIGKWTLEIHNEGRFAGRTILKRWSLIAYGTDMQVNSSRSSYSSSPSSSSPSAATSTTSKKKPIPAPPAAFPAPPPPQQQPPPPIRYPAIINLSYLSNKTFATRLPPSILAAHGLPPDSTVPTLSYMNLLHLLGKGQGAPDVGPRGKSNGTSTSSGTSSGVPQQQSRPPNGKGGKNKGRQKAKAISKKQKASTVPGSRTSSANTTAATTFASAAGLQRRLTSGQQADSPLVVDPSGSSIDRNKTEDKLDGLKFSNQTVISGSAKQKPLNRPPPTKSDVEQTSGPEVTPTENTSPRRGSSNVSSSVSSSLVASNASEQEATAGATSGDLQRNSSHSIDSIDEQGKLLNWALVAHGTVTDPNGSSTSAQQKLNSSPAEATTLRSAPGATSKKQSRPLAAADLQPSIIDITQHNNNNANADDLNKVATDFDGDPLIKQLQLGKAQLGVDAIPADLSASSSASAASLPFCAKFSSSGTCLDCVPPHILHGGFCVSACPEGFYQEKRGLSGTGTRKGSEFANISFVCRPCHYSCRTCAGPHNFECLSCHQDATLDLERPAKGVASEDVYHDLPVYSYCYPASMLTALNSNEFSYKLLSVAFAFTVLASIGMAIYIVCLRRSSRLVASVASGGGGKQRSNPYYRISPEEDSGTSSKSKGYYEGPLQSDEEDSDDADEDVSFVRSEQSMSRILERNSSPGT